MADGYAERDPQDVLAGRLRIRLAGEWYIVPVLTRGENADWIASLDDELGAVIAAEDDLDIVVSMMHALDDKLLGLLYSYDKAHVLPPIESIERDVYPHEVLRAVMEVRLAANPTLGYALASLVSDHRLTAGTPSSSSPPPPTAGRSRKSRAG